MSAGKVAELDQVAAINTDTPYFYILFFMELSCQVGGCFYSFNRVVRIYK